MNKIGIYVPGWFYRSAQTDRLFVDELMRTIRESGRYTPARVNLPRLRIVSEAAAKAYCRHRGIELIIMHDSPYFGGSARYSRTVRFLERVVPVINSHDAHLIGHNKIFTKRRLATEGIPVLPDAVISSPDSLLDHMLESQWYVAKPADSGGGAGVRLIRRLGSTLLLHLGGNWFPVTSRSPRPGAIALGTFWNYRFGFTYSPMLVEPYFNDDPDGFSSLRCTVVGGDVIEAVKRVNRKNITSNVSGGGTATTITLLPEQSSIAVAAAKAIGADYAGVDLLVCGGQTIVGEVNIGPITIFSGHTGAPVGKALAELAMRSCDQRFGLHHLN